MTVFALIDDHVGDIEETTFRIEANHQRRALQRQDGDITTDRLLVALGLLGSSGLAPDTEVAARVRVLTDPLPLSAARIYMPARRAPSRRSGWLRYGSLTLRWYGILRLSMLLTSG